jgi:plastocyanin
LGWFEPDTATIDWSTANGDQGEITVSPGDIVTWVWGDNAAHDVVPTSDPPGFSASAVIQEQGYSHSAVMTQLGDFAFEDSQSGGAKAGYISVIARRAEHIVDWSVAQGNQGTLEIQPGDVVTWVWGDSNTHDVSPTSNPNWGFAPSELVQGEGYKFTYVFNKLGRFGFECTNHPGQMFGTVAVLALNPPHVINWRVSSGDQGTLYVNRLDTVTWVWTDDETHNITPETQRLPFDWVPTADVAQKGYNHSVTFGEFGEYPYSDSNNPSTMFGVVSVNNDVLPSRAPTPSPSMIPTAPTFSLTEAPSAATKAPTQPPSSLRPTVAPTGDDTLVSGACTTLGCHTPAAVALPIAMFVASMLFL